MTPADDHPLNFGDTWAACGSTAKHYGLANHVIQQTDLQKCQKQVDLAIIVHQKTMFSSFSVLVCLCLSLTAVSSKYLPTWDSLDTRPLPQWYDEAKFGIFIHWGVFAVPGFGSEWFWERWQREFNPIYIKFMKDNYKPGFSYADFAPMFTAQFYDPDEWADLFAKSGAKYIVLTTKHHEGWTNWKSNVSWNWNAVDNGPHRDLVGDLAVSLRNRTDLRLGLYHSLYEWFNPLFLKDQANGFKTQEYVKNILQHQLTDIVMRFKPEYVWSDGDADASADYWTSKEYIAWLYNESPVKDTVVVNDRWGSGVPCHHGDVYTCHDQYNPGKLVNHKWENCFKVDQRSWGYRRHIKFDEINSIEAIISQLVSTVSCGGNLLLNIGPNADGVIVPVFQERLLQMGEWLKVNGEAIYGTVPWPKAQNDTITKDVWYTKKNKTVYAISLDWPSSGSLVLGVPVPTSSTKVTLLGGSELSWGPHKPSGIQISIPSIPVNKLPCKWAWSFKLEFIE